jgi:hypothetical protein
VVASFLADLTTLAGKSAVILASGFLNPATNQNGEPFALMAVLADGTVIILSNVTSINDVQSSIGVKLYPNPANDFLFVELNDKKALISNVKISDITGRTVTEINELSSSGTGRIDVSSLKSGVYNLSYLTKDGANNTRFIVK